MSFANLPGAWALLGLAAVLAIHLLQRRTRPVVISTLFLLDPFMPRLYEGSRIERLRRSASLWLQLLAVLLLTWLLMAPRFLRAESVQRVVVLLDASASMSAFREPLRAALDRRTASLSRGAARTEWVLVDTSLGQRTLFSGVERDGLLRALEGWEPLLGTHDTAPALEIARTLAGRQGLVLFVTDHVEAAPDGTELLAVGSPIDNVGFLGAEAEVIDGQASFRALVKNHGRTEATRSYRARAGTSIGPPVSLRLAPGAVKVISGPFLPGADAFELLLDSDGFALDDRLPLVRPRPKPLRVSVSAAAERSPFVPRFLATLDEVIRVEPGAHPDLVIAAYGETSSTPIRSAAILLDTAASGSARYLEGPIVADDHPLVADLNWQGLLARSGPGRAYTPGPADHVVLWQGTSPLVVLRGKEPARQLVVTFSLPDSNADRLPALPLLLHRFAETVRAATVGHEQRNVETGQRLRIAADAQGPALRLEAPGTAPGPPPAERSNAVASDTLLRAPGRPGFFRVLQGDEPRVTGAAHFAEALEADLSRAASREQTSRYEGVMVRRNSREDPLTPLWVLLLAGVLMADWRLQARARPSRPS